LTDIIHILKNIEETFLKKEISNRKRQAMTIRNMKDSEVYFKDFHSMDEARNWVINHLDLSKEWLIILIKPKKQEQ
jgi:hypothetical protein